MASRASSISYTVTPSALTSIDASCLTAEASPDATAAAVNASRSAETPDVPGAPSRVLNAARALSRVCLAIAYTCSCSLAAPVIPPPVGGAPVAACSAAPSDDGVRRLGLVRPSFSPSAAPLDASCSILRSKPCRRSSRALPASSLMSESTTWSASISKPDD